MTAISVVPPPMSITMLPVGVSTGRPTPIAAAIGSATMNTSFAPAPSAESRTARFSTSVMPDGTHTITRGFTLKTCLSMIGLEEVAQHLLGHVEVGDDAVLQRPHRDDAVGRAPEHALRLEPDALDLPVACSIATTEGSFSTMPFALHVDERVRGAEIHGDRVRGEERTELEP